MGTRFSARPDRPWGPPSLLYNGHRVFPGGRGGSGRGSDPPPHLECRGPRKSRAIPLLTLRAFVAYKKGENLPTYEMLCTHSTNDAELSNHIPTQIYNKIITYLICVFKWSLTELIQRAAKNHVLIQKLI